MTKRWISIVLTAVLVLTSISVTGVGTLSASAAAPTFKVTDYGARNGKECADAIQAALDDAAASGTAQQAAVVEIPAGTYYLAKTLNINSNVTIKCDAKTEIVKQDVGRGYMLRVERFSAPGYSGVSNVTIDGGTWDAKYYKQFEKTGGSHMYFVHGENLTFKNVTFKHNYGAHMLELGGVRNVQIENCTFDGFKKAPGTSSGLIKEAIQLDIAHNEDILPDAAPYDDTTCKDITIRNNRFLNYARGVGAHSTVKGVYAENIVIEDNTFENMTDQAIYATRFVNLTVRGNTMKNTPIGITFKVRNTAAGGGWYNANAGVKTKTVSDYKVLIEDNKITTTAKPLSQNPQQFGIWVYGISGDPASGVTIRNNTITSASSAIFLNNTKQVRIYDNTIKRNSNTSAKSFLADGIKVNLSKTVDIRRNHFYKNGSNRFISCIALRTVKGTSVVSDNILDKKTAKEDGILIGETTAAQVNGNTVSSAGKHGLYLRKSNITALNGNKISGCGGAIYGNGSKIKGYKNNIFISNGATAVLNIGCSATMKTARALTVNKVKAGAKKITGATMAGKKITVSVKGKNYKGKAKSNGSFSVKVKKCKKKDAVQVSVSLGGGNILRQTVKAV